MDLISTERDLLNQYTTTFSQQQTDLVTKYQAVSDRLDSNIQIENDETTSLAQVQKQLDGLSLSATMDNFTQIKTNLAAKFQAYTDVVHSNNTVATALFAKLQDSKDVVGQISALLKDIDSTIDQINTTIDTYSSASSTTSPTSITTPAAATAAADVVSADVPATPTAPSAE